MRTVERHLAARNNERARQWGPPKPVRTALIDRQVVTPRTFTLIGLLIVVLLLAFASTGCATVENYCEEQPGVCATAAGVCVFAVTVVAVHKFSPGNQVQVRSNAPGAPITVPGCVGSACSQ